VEVGWNSLSEEVRGVLEGLRPGQVSRPVEQGGGHHLFLIEAWLDGGPSQAEIEAVARRELAARRREQAYQTLLLKLRAGSSIQVSPRNLPFEYRPENDA
jgi:parvulin-like peptidyl-prolyl isomerase